MEMPLAVTRPATQQVQERFARLLRPELDHAYQLAGYLLGGAGEAEDAAAEAVARAWGRFDGLRDDDRFGPWLTRIVVNVCRDRLRRRRIVPFVPLDPDEPAAEGADPFASALARDAVGRALRLLGPDQRAVVVLHYWNDRSVAEIASILRIPSGTVKWRLRAACRRMRPELEREGSGR
jgi:RNA polymerase sigma factor (sigma-70 family)